MSDVNSKKIRRLRWWPWMLIAVGAFVLIGIIAGLAGRGSSPGVANDGAPPPASTPVAASAERAEEVVETVTVPDVVGLTMVEARAKLSAVGLTLETTDAGDDWVVTAQHPAAGEHSVDGLSMSVTSEAPKPVYSLEQQNALRAAQSYLDLTGFSRQGLIDQLSSEYGSAYPVDVATWAADTVGADWNAEAVESAKSYLDLTSFSRQGLYEQLTSAYGGQFTPDEANYALAAVGY